MSYNFKPGDRVVCVDASTINNPPDRPLVKGAVYTVRALWTLTSGECGIIPVGIDPGYDFTGWAFRASRFRPVAEKPTSMDIIRAIVLDPSKPIEDDPREPVITPVPEYEQGAML